MVFRTEARRRVREASDKAKAAFFNLASDKTVAGLHSWTGYAKSVNGILEGLDKDMGNAAKHLRALRKDVVEGEEDTRAGKERAKIDALLANLSEIHEMITNPGESTVESLKQTLKQTGDRLRDAFNNKGTGAALELIAKELDKDVTKAKLKLGMPGSDISRIYQLHDLGGKAESAEQQDRNIRQHRGPRSLTPEKHERDVFDIADSVNRDMGMIEEQIKILLRAQAVMRLVDGFERIRTGKNETRREDAGRFARTLWETYDPRTSDFGSLGEPSARGPAMAITPLAKAIFNQADEVLNDAEAKIARKKTGDTISAGELDDVSDQNRRLFAVVHALYPRLRAKEKLEINSALRKANRKIEELVAELGPGYVLYEVNMKDIFREKQLESAEIQSVISRASDYKQLAEEMKNIYKDLEHMMNLDALAMRIIELRKYHTAAAGPEASDIEPVKTAKGIRDTSSGS